MFFCFEFSLTDLVLVSSSSMIEATEHHGAVSELKIHLNCRRIMVYLAMVTWRKLIQSAKTLVSYQT